MIAIIFAVCNHSLYLVEYRYKTVVINLMKLQGYSMLCFIPCSH